MIDLPKIVTQEQVVLENKELFPELMKLTISDLVELEKINAKKHREINSEIEFKVIYDSMDEIDKIEIKKFLDKSHKLSLLIREAINSKYNDFLKKIV